MLILGKHVNQNNNQLIKNTDDEQTHTHTIIKIANMLLVFLDKLLVHQNTCHKETKKMNRGNSKIITRCEAIRDCNCKYPKIILQQRLVSKVWDSYTPETSHNSDLDQKTIPKPVIQGRYLE